MLHNCAVKINSDLYISQIIHPPVLCGAKFNQNAIITEIYLNFALLLIFSFQMKHIPNLITCLNLASGFISILFAVNGEIVTASWLILAAMIFDFLDGFSARLLKAYSDIGKELDSLADAVSFGAAPAIIIYQLLGNSMSLPAPMIASSLQPAILIILMSPVIMIICAALRLAKFNTDSSQTSSFRGLPTPASALIVISLVIAWHYTEIDLLNRFIGSTTALLILTLVLSLLMVSRIPLLSLKFTHFRLKGNEGRYLLILLVALSLAIFGIAAATLIIPFYLVVSLLSTLFK
jgi:CDP-diacylglycerol--serine O-phosphatidyltransferase